MNKNFIKNIFSVYVFILSSLIIVGLSGCAKENNAPTALNTDQLPTYSSDEVMQDRKNVTESANIYKASLKATPLNLKESSQLLNEYIELLKNYIAKYSKGWHQNDDPSNSIRYLKTTKKETQDELEHLQKIKQALDQQVSKTTSVPSEISTSTVFSTSASSGLLPEPYCFNPDDPFDSLTFSCAPQTHSRIKLENVVAINCGINFSNDNLIQNSDELKIDQGTQAEGANAHNDLSAILHGEKFALHPSLSQVDGENKTMIFWLRSLQPGAMAKLFKEAQLKNSNTCVTTLGFTALLRQSTQGYTIDKARLKFYFDKTLPNSTSPTVEIKW